MKNLGLTLFVVLISISLINAQMGMGGLGGGMGGGLMPTIMSGIMSGVMRAMGGGGGMAGMLGGGSGSGSGSSGMSPRAVALMQDINSRPTDTNNIINMLFMNGKCFALCQFPVGT